MAIRRKNRRPIEIDGRRYVWWVVSDEEECGALTLTVVSEDKHFFVKYHLVQSEDARHLAVKGRDFRQRTDGGGRWRRFRCPAFGTSGTVAPKDVVALVRWSKTGDDALIEVDWQGTPTRDAT